MDGDHGLTPTLMQQQPTAESEDTQQPTQPHSWNKEHAVQKKKKGL